MLPALALGLFCWAFVFAADAAWGLSVIAGPAGLACALFLAGRFGVRKTGHAIGVSLAFGAAFPLVAANFSGVYGFSAGVPTLLPALWCSLLLLAVALTESLTRASRLTGARRPLVCGLTLACLESVWDRALLAQGVLWSAAPSFGTWRLGYTPGWAAAHFLIGWLLQDCLDTFDERSPSFLRDAAYVTLPPLAFVFSSRLVPAGFAGPAIADVATAVLWTGLLVLLARRVRGEREHGVLLVTTTAPFDPYDGDEYALDFYSSRFTKGQGPFVSESETPYLALHFIARNLRTPALVLEFPSEAELEAELRRSFHPVVGISFVNVNRPRVARMCRLIRAVSPDTRIVLGGYGVVCLDQSLGQDDRMEGLFDDVCRGEGVRYMRELLGEDPEAPLSHELPFQRVYPLGMRFVSQPMAPLIAGFGCARRCEFCATSAFFGGRHLQTASAEEIAEAVGRAFERCKSLAAVPIFDEDYLADARRARRVGELLSQDPRVPSGASPLSIFATVAGLCAVGPQDLVRMRIGYVWTGVESRFSGFSKLRGEDVPAMFEALHAHGIAITGSFIVGLDEQTPENIDEDLEWLARLNPVTAQIGLLGAIPGTSLHKRMGAERRLTSARWEDQHLYHEVLRYKHLKPGEAHAAMRRGYELLYRRNGPSILKMWQVWLRGQRTLRAAADPALRARSEELTRLLTLARPAVVAVRQLSPDAHVRELAARALETFASEVRQPRVTDHAQGLGATAWVAWRAARLALLGKPKRQPVSRRYSYS